MQGTATTAAPPTTTAGAGADGVDVAALKPGNYPTAPLPEEPWSVQGAIRMQAKQMADFVVGPWEVDPALTGLHITPVVIIDAENLKGVLLEAGTVAAKHHFINAFSSTRTDGDDADSKKLVTMVMRFPTSEDAAAAATETSAALGTYLKAGAQEMAFIPGHPEAQATQSPQVGGKYQVTSLTPHGPFVLYQEATSSENAEAAAALVAKTLDLQAPRIDTYHPTDPAQKTSLDPTGLVARTIPDVNTKTAGVYGVRGAVHFDQNPVRSGERYNAAGVDFTAAGTTQVIQAKDPAAAAAYASGLFDANSAGQEPGPTVPGLPAAKCLQNPRTGNNADPTAPPTYRCIAPMGRWVVLAAGQQAAAVTQQIAAQYLMLIGK
ncbi:hypothetical protein [Mycobacterium sp. URHB0044]|uniref:DUF7373 family lipoprotein n=1 Tax=Mycobacterium sp. URHB0044 TaxID=1380386 RepID=UPI0012DE4B07|nr:hypothetical protein [Mycobacterium sp. URHB0044]